MTALGIIILAGTLDGIPIKIGGTRDIVPVHIQHGPIIYSGCVAPRPLAKRISQHLFTREIRLLGTGRWKVSGAGDWHLDHFAIADFEELDDAPLLEVVSDLRAIPGNEWPTLADPWTELSDIRSGRI